MKLIKQIIHRLFGAYMSRRIWDIAENIGPVIDQTATQIVFLFETELRIRPLSQVLPAIWHDAGHDTMSFEQRQIHERIAGAVDDIIGMFGFRLMNTAQKFALAYLVRGLIWASIVNRMEINRHVDLPSMIGAGRQAELLSRIEPMGNA